MINREFHSKNIQFSLVESNNLIPIDNWSNYIEYSIANVFYSILENGFGERLEDYSLVIPYSNLIYLDEYEYSTLGLPDIYPFDIFIDIEGAGLSDLNVKIKYSFQDFSHGIGTGNIIFKKENLIGAYLSSGVEYLLTPKQYLLVSEIKDFNNNRFNTRNEILQRISKIQELALDAKATLSRTLHDTIIVAPKTFNLSLKPVDNDIFRLDPIIEGVDNKIFSEKLLLSFQGQSIYNFMSNDKKYRIVINENENARGNSLLKELEKIKRKRYYSKREVNEIYDSPNSYWDPGLIDMDNFGQRVLELGIYEPKYNPFVSNYKSKWLPGIAVENKKDGNKHLLIYDHNELSVIENLYESAKSKGKDSITYRSEVIDLTSIEAIIQVAKLQLQDCDRTIFTETYPKFKTINKHVLIIKENTISDDYTEKFIQKDEVIYTFEKVLTLSSEISLRVHQKEGIAWLQTLCQKPYDYPGVLLADDMGLGKTLQVLYFLEWYFHNKSTKSSLIIAPVSLLENWNEEFKKFFPASNISIKLLSGKNLKKYFIPHDLHNTIINLSKGDLFLTSYENLRLQQIPLALVDWALIILDEAQKIKSPGTFVTNSAKALKGEFKIAITGTPVENNLMDLWCILDFCMPGLLGNAKNFSTIYQKPFEKNKDDYTELSQNLRQIIGNSMLRRLKIDVIEGLPSLTSHRYLEIMPDRQYHTYLSELEDISRKKQDASIYGQMLQGLQNLKRISDHPFLRHFQIENFNSDELIASSAKLRKLVSIVEDVRKEEQKLIVFSESKSMQRVLQKIIQEVFKLRPTIINGDTPASKSDKDNSKLSRQQEINKFQQVKGFNLIIMSPIAAGFGLNVTEANHVIHYTRHWNPAKEQQATDRVYRIGQNLPVNVYYLLAATPDDNIKSFDLILDELLTRKSKLAKNTLFPTDRIQVQASEFSESTKIINKNRTSIEIGNIIDLDILKTDLFEASIAVLYEKMANGATHLVSLSNEVATKIILFHGDSDILIYAKSSLTLIDVKTINELIIISKEFNQKHHNRSRPIFVTNSNMSTSAKRKAIDNEIVTIERTELSKWILENPIDMNKIERKLDDIWLSNKASL